MNLILNRKASPNPILDGDAIRVSEVASYPVSLADVILLPKIEDFLEASAESLGSSFTLTFREIQTHRSDTLLCMLIAYDVLSHLLQKRSNSDDYGWRYNGLYFEISG
jgi:hypothetical protein